MRYPWANIAVLVLIAAQLISGFEGLTHGSPSQAWILWLHGIGAYALVVVAFWKGSVVADSLRRRRRPLLLRLAYLLLTALLIATVVLGMLWTFAGRRLLLGYSLITIHILLAFAVLALLVVHVFHMRFIFRVASADRRAFLKMAGATVAGLALWQLSGRAMSFLGLPGSRRRFTGSYETGSFTGDFPVVIWLFDQVPSIDPRSWRLSIEGEVERPFTLSYEDLMGLASERMDALIDCTGGWYSTQEWQGVRVGRLLERAGVKAGAQSVTFEAVSGYSRRFPIDEAPGHLLATRVAGQILDPAHGFPVRLVAPDHRGYNWVKWLVRIRVNPDSSHLQPPVPLQ